MRSLLHLGRDERGTSVVELAIVAPFFATLLIGVVDLSNGYSQKLQLEQAAQRAIEKAMQAEKDDTPEDDASFYQSLQQEAAAAAGVADNAVTVKYWLECNGVSQNTSPATMEADYEKVCAGGQTYARYVTVRIQKTYTPMFSMKFAGANADGTYTLAGEAGIRVQ